MKVKINYDESKFKMKCSEITVRINCVMKVQISCNESKIRVNCDESKLKINCDGSKDKL